MCCEDEKCDGTNRSKSINMINIELNSFGRGLVMPSLKINSLLAHIDELRVFMSNFKIDILSINGTKLDSSIDDSEAYLPGFEITRKDRNIFKLAKRRRSLYLCDVI